MQKCKVLWPQNSLTEDFSTERDPGNFYLLLDIRPSEVYNTIANRTEILSSSLKFQIWKRFIDENRSVLILYGDSVIADHTIYALPAYIKVLSYSKNPINMLIYSVV
jgi:hypothetical protein